MDITPDFSSGLSMGLQIATSPLEPSFPMPLYFRYVSQVNFPLPSFSAQSPLCPSPGASRGGEGTAAGLELRLNKAHFQGL